MKNKKMIAKISIGVVVFIAIVIGLIMFFVGGKEQYRVIKVFEFDGDATVTREDIGEVTPYINMLLESGDQVFLKSGNMTLKMDEDKYAYVEENTKFSINAEGTEENSKTTIDLMEGAITNEIQNPLSAESSYEINTPNSTMAVRGTVFRACVYYGDDGTCYTKVSVFKGKVSTRLVNSDGTVSGNELIIEGGKEAIIYQNDEETNYVSEERDIVYSEFSDVVNKLLDRILGNRDGKKKKKADKKTTGKKDTTSADESATDKDSWVEKSTSEETTEQTTEQQRTDANETEERTTEERTTEERTTEERTTEERTTEERTTEEETTEERTTEEETTEDTYTIKFMYKGSVFGTQTVKKGEKATIPTLMPSASGSWDFDFDTVITEDTIINWK